MRARVYLTGVGVRRDIGSRALLSKSVNISARMLRTGHDRPRERGRTGGSQLSETAARSQVLIVRPGLSRELVLLVGIVSAV
jgi:hypothetical protein